MNITKELLTDLYCNQLLPRTEICSQLRIADSALSTYIKQWGLHRDPKAVRQANHPTAATEFTPNQVEELRELYLEQNMTYEEIKRHFNLTGWTLDKILRENNIHKSKKVSVHIGLQTKYSRAGSREAYFKHMHEAQKQTYMERDGSLEEHYRKVSESCSKTWNAKSWEEKKRLNNISMSHGAGWNHQTSRQTLITRYGVDNAYKLASCTSDSQPNRAFAQQLISAGIDFKSEVYLTTPESSQRGFRYDFQIENTLVEVDPWPFHNITFSPIASQSPISKTYHLQKTKTATSQGYRCIHVFDWDDVPLLLSHLQLKHPIAARKCTVKEVSKEDTDIFLHQHHLQGTCKSQTVRLGLYLDSQLIQLMTFGKPRYNKKYQWELLRLCTQPGFAVIGGAKKLFNCFEKQYQPTTIISYCDLSKFEGTVYEKLGTNLLRQAAPSKHWYNPKTKQHITDNLLRQRGFDQLLGKQFGCYGKGTSNEELMRQHGFVEIYDCGQASFEWHSSS